MQQLIYHFGPNFVDVICREVSVSSFDAHFYMTPAYVNFVPIINEDQVLTSSIQFEIKIILELSRGSFF